MDDGALRKQLNSTKIGEYMSDESERISAQIDIQYIEKIKKLLNAPYTSSRPYTANVLQRIKLLIAEMESKELDNPSLHRSDIENSGVDIDKPSDELRIAILECTSTYKYNEFEPDKPIQVRRLNKGMVDTLIALFYKERQQAIDAAVKEARIDELNKLKMSGTSVGSFAPGSDGEDIVVIEGYQIDNRIALLNQPQEKK